MTLEKQFDKIVEKYTTTEVNALKGLAFIVVDKHGDTLYSKAVGSREIDITSGSHLHIDSVFYIASLTKAITTLACMIAVENGLLALDENVRDIVPELQKVECLIGFEESDKFPRKPILEDVTDPISLRQLLSHSSGFIYDQLHPGILEWSQYVGRTDHTFTGSLAGYTHPLIFQPGQGWAYGPGMDWAGRTIEVVSGLTLEEFMQKNIFSKLGMNDTTFRAELRPDFPARTMATAWRDRETGLLSTGVVPLALPAKDCCGGAGLYSTPEDFSKILKLILQEGGDILSKESIDEMMKPQLPDLRWFWDVTTGPSKRHLAQTWPEGAKGTFGLSSSINLEDFPGRRPRNSVNWSGMPGCHAWVDREAGISGLLMTQVFPPGDPMVTKCLLELETALYTHLREGIRTIWK
ncbi:hypothetical protein O988_03418 [Pseudogymnoascus sp. VKM F-3808]|nr:hypothetical protein O988_03418 [Pseudogymnoascus sp. VKM F-3808]